MDVSVRTDLFYADGQDWLGSARGLQSTQTIALLLSAFTANIHYPLGFLPSGLALAKFTSGANAGKYGPVLARPNEVQTVTITGTPTGGTFTLTLDGQTTAGIPFNATASAVQTALEAMSNVSPGEAVVTGGPGPATPYIVTFSGSRWAGIDVPQMTASAASLTGGTPVIAVTTSTGGGSGVTDGSDQLAGFLAFAVRAPYLINPAPVLMGTLLDTGRVVVANLPVPVSANVQATNPRFVFV